LNKATDKRLETAGKKWVVRELDVINKLCGRFPLFMESTPQTYLAKFLGKDAIHQCPVFITAYQ
jgi:hypothetical protein